METPVYTFRVPESDPTSFAFLLYGGTNTREAASVDAVYNEAHEMLVNQMLQDLASQQGDFPEIAGKLRFAVHLGDIGYDGGRHAGWNEQLFWPAAGLMRELPYLPVPGDMDYGAEKPEGQNALRAFLDWPNEPPGNQAFSYSFDLGRARFVIGDAGDSRHDSSYGDFIRTAIDDIKDNLEDFDWRFVFYHTPGYAESLAKPFFPRDPPDSYTEGWQIRQTLFSNEDSLADAARHVTMIACGHNHQYERASILPTGEPLLPQFVIGRAGFHSEGDAPWPTQVDFYEDPGRTSGSRQIPQPSQEDVEKSWLGYAFVLVAPDGVNPAVVRVKSRMFKLNPAETELTFVFEEVLDLQER